VFDAVRKLGGLRRDFSRKKNSLKNDSRKIDKKRCIRDIWETVLVLLRQSREQELKLIIFVKLN
jgi:hypothetical protein